jgi:hypothetical protein
MMAVASLLFGNLQFTSDIGQPRPGNRPSGREGGMIQINAVSLDSRRNWRMARRLSIIDVAAIAVIVLSVAVLAYVGFAIWSEP